jgi:23S rRNA pseudouridine2605 synthase
MRLNQYIALHTGISRRRADELIKSSKVLVNHRQPQLGQIVEAEDKIEVNGLELKKIPKLTTIMLNKPVGYVCSRAGQGSRTIYDLLPKRLHHLKPAGRLDKDSSGLLIMTNDGHLANQLTHPHHQKKKVYEVELDKPLTREDKNKIEEGVMLKDGLSRLEVTDYGLEQGSDKTVTYRVAMHEGRNRQIRRTFAALGYNITKLHRTHFGSYTLENLKAGKNKII